MIDLLPDRHPLAAEINISRLYRSAYREHPARREMKALRGQFPAVFHLPMTGDLLCGRAYLSPGVLAPRRALRKDPDRLLELRLPALGFAALRPACGPSAPYFWDRDLFARKCAAIGELPAELAAECRELVAFWDAEHPTERCYKSFSPAVRAAMPMSEPFGSDPALPLIRMTGPMLDWQPLLAGGLAALRQRLHAARKDCGPTGDREFLAAAEEAIDLCADSARWFAERVEDPALAADCLHIAEAAPQTFRQACQLMYLWAVLGSSFQFGRLDDDLGPFLVADLEAGRLDEEGALAIIGSLWQLIHDCGAEFDNRVVIGGMGRRHPMAADRFALLAIEATRRCGLQLPQLSLRFHQQQDPALYQAALDCLGEGRTFPILYNDDCNVPAVMRAMDVPRQQAEQYVPYGCGEYVLNGLSFGTPSGAINLAMVLDATLRGGICADGRRVLPPGPRLDQMRDFEELWQRYSGNVEQLLMRLAEQQKQEYDFVGGEAAYCYWSLLYRGCLERGRALFDGGVQHLGGTMESYGQTNAADALHAIKDAVFDTGSVTAKELLSALDADFRGHENIQRVLQKIAKYGNDDAAADAMAKRVHEQVCLCTRDQAARVGLDSYLVVIINNMMNTVLGGQTGATADGRSARQPFANANNPQPGADRNGVSAMFNSLLKLDPSIHAGAVQNVKFTPAWFAEDRPKLEMLMDVWWRQGGSQAMLTVVDRSLLEEARREPEKHPYLLVRVGGFSARFVELSPEVQAEVIARTLND